ncbi:MAG TPA: hypothetical protein PK728_07785 [Bacillota bacterium]|nr:hypothetical protein [Bacillota bacterium]
MISSQDGAEMVSELASAINRKIVAPAAGRLDSISLETRRLSKRIEELEKDIRLLQTAHERTRALALVSLLGLCGVVAVVSLFK